MKRILLFGKNGQVGQALQQSLAGAGSIVAHDRSSCDLASADDIRDAIRRTNPSVIINAAAYTAVDQAEGDEATCMQVNAAAPAVMATEARRLGALMIHYSTDYVFDGRKAQPYLEDDRPNPVNAYGRSKLAGDLAVAAAGGSYVVLRVAWVYSASGRNFARTILRLAGERDQLTIVDDQFGTPTSAGLIAGVTGSLVQKFFDQQQANTASVPSGIYNLAPKGTVSWHGFATELVRAARHQGVRLRVADDQILPIASTHYPTPAQRPANSTFDTGKLQRLLGHALPDWRDDMTRVVSELAPVARQTEIAVVG